MEMTKRCSGSQPFANEVVKASLCRALLGKHSLRPGRLLPARPLCLMMASSPAGVLTGPRLVINCPRGRSAAASGLTGRVIICNQCVVAVAGFLFQSIFTYHSIHMACCCTGAKLDVKMK